MKLFKYVLILALAFCGTSCKKWLDVKPTSQLDRSDLFSSEDGYVESLTGVYANLTRPELYGRELTWGTLDLIAGVYYPSITGNYAAMHQYQYKRNNSGYSEVAGNTINNIWDNMYKQVANLNALLETIDDNKNIFRNDHYKIIKGEALGLRAFLHLELLRMFGPSYAANGAGTIAIPFVNQLSTSVAPILTVDNAMEFIINDLKVAKELMANDPIRLGVAPDPVLAPTPTGNYANFGVASYHNRRFTFNYYAVTATLARAYLWKGEKVNALQYAKEVIADQATRFPWARTSNISTIGGNAFNQDRTFATEHVFALNIRRINDYMEGYCYFGTSSFVETRLYPYAYLSYASTFEGSTDIRNTYLGTSFSGNRYCNKYHQFNDVYVFFQQRVPLIRISEMYYIAAECETDLTQARAYLEAVRSNRGLSNLALSPNISRIQLDNEIQKEYQKEFIAEGQLWYYLKRKDLDLTDFMIGGFVFNIYYFTNKNQFVFDRPIDEDGNR